MSKTVQIVMVPLHMLAKEQRPKKCEFVILCHDLTFHDFKKPQTQFTELKPLIKIQMSILMTL